MLKVIWLGILILAYSVSSSLQHDSVSAEDDDVQQHSNNLKPTNSKVPKKESLGDRLEYFVRHAKEGNNGELPKEIGDLINGHEYETTVDSNGPKRVKITYRKRTIKAKKPTRDSKTGNENSKNHEMNFGHDIDGSLNSKDAELVPQLLKYLNKYGSEKHNVADDVNSKKDIVAARQRLEDNADNVNKISRKYSFNGNDWNNMELASSKVKENIPDTKQVPEKGVIGTIYFPNTKLHSESNEKETLDSNLMSEKLTTKKELQVDFPSVNDLSKIYNDGKKVATYEWNSNPLGADDKEKEASNSAVSNDLDPSKIDILVKKMCVNSKTNFLEFWKLAAGYFGLNHGNLSDKQKYDLFLSILKEVNDKKQQDDVEIVPSNPENEALVSKKIIPQEVIPTESTKTFYGYDHSEPEETHDQKQKLNEEVLFSGPNQKVVDGLGSAEISLLNTIKPDIYEGAPIKEAPLKDNFGGINLNNEKLLYDLIKSAETNSDQSPKSLKSSEILLNYFDSALGPTKETVISGDQPKATNGKISPYNEGHSVDIIKFAETNPAVFSNSEPPQVTISDSDFKSNLFNFTENEDDPISEKTSLKPEIGNIIKQDNSVQDEEPTNINKKSKENTININLLAPQATNVNSEQEIKGLPELSTLRPTKSKNVFDEQVLNNLLDYLNATVSKEDVKPADNVYISLQPKKTSPENIDEEHSGSKKKSLNPIQISKEILSEVFSKEKPVDDLEESDSSKENNSKRLAVLLHYLKTLPKEKLAEIVLSMKYNFGKKNNEHGRNHPEDLIYPSNLHKSILESDENDTDKYKILAHLFEDQTKDKVSNVLLDSKGNDKINPKLLLKYNLAPKNKGPTNIYKFVPYQSLDDYFFKSNQDDSDENSRRPKTKHHLKWNVKLNVLSKVLLQMISKFREYGISDEALREIIGDLKQALSENEGKTDCQAQELNKKLNSIKKALELLSSLKKQAEAKTVEI